MLSLKAVAHNLLGQRDEARALIDFERFIRLRRFEAPDGYASLDDFNKTLVGDVCAHPTLQFERAGHATRNGRHTGNILIDADGAVKTLEEMIGSAVEGYLGEMTADPAHPFLADPPRRWHLSAWAVVMDTEGHQLEHIHPAAWLSGCYYAQVPDAIRAAGDDHSGWIEFGQPEQSLRSDISSETTIHQPEEGLIVLFPSYFYHHTVPFTSTENRVSIAFDVHRDA